MDVSVAGNTLLLTPFGPQEIQRLCGSPVDVWDGRQFARRFVYSGGSRPLYRVSWSNGATLDCTTPYPPYRFDFPLPESKFWEGHPQDSDARLLVQLQNIGVRARLRDGCVYTDADGAWKCQKRIPAPDRERLKLRLMDQTDAPPVIVQVESLDDGETFSFAGPTAYNGVLLSFDQ